MPRTSTKPWQDAWSIDHLSSCKSYTWLQIPTGGHYLWTKLVVYPSIYIQKVAFGVRFDYCQHGKEQTPSLSFPIGLHNGPSAVRGILAIPTRLVCGKHTQLHSVLLFKKSNISLLQKWFQMWIKIAVCDKEMLFSISEENARVFTAFGKHAEEALCFWLFNIPFTVCYFSLKGFPGKKKKRNWKVKC